MLSFAKYLTESMLSAAQDRLASLGSGPYVPTTALFLHVKPAPMTPEAAYTYGPKPTMLTLPQRAKLIATQPQLLRSRVEHYLTLPNKDWNLMPRDRTGGVLVAWKDGLYYVLDGHHRVAAAKLLRLNFLPAFLVNLD